VSEEKITVRRRRLPNKPGIFTVTDQAAGTVLGMVTVDPPSGREGIEVAYNLLPER
jgi:hypothetical protein